MTLGRCGCFSYHSCSFNTSALSSWGNFLYCSSHEAYSIGILNFNRLGFFWQEKNYSNTNKWTKRTTSRFKSQTTLFNDVRDNRTAQQLFFKCDLLVYSPFVAIAISAKIWYSRKSMKLCAANCSTRNINETMIRNKKNPRVSNTNTNRVVMLRIPAIIKPSNHCI